MRPALAAAFFFVSGLTGLVYQVVWARRLELTMGSTTHSIGIVLAVFMAGLGAGAWFFGRRADQAGSAARRYAGLEAGIGVWGLVAPFVLMGVEAIYAAVGGAGGVVTKAGLAFLALFPSTFCMGGTLPILARPFIPSDEVSPRAVGLLYGWNTLGAVLGVLLADLVFMTTLGLSMTSRLMGLVNLVLAAAAWTLGSRLAPDVTAREDPAPASPWPRAPLAIALTVGLIGLALEVAFTRALGMALGSTRHAFAMVLAATLLGIGGGSLGVARVSDTDTATRRLRWTLGGLGLGCWLFLTALPGLQVALFHLVQPRMLGYGQLLTAEFGLLIAAMLPTTLALGAAFPLVVRLAAPGPRAGQVLGRVYLANTVGAILGSILAAFVLLQLLGPFRLIQVLGLVAVAAGLLLQKSRSTIALLALLALIVGLATQPPWPPERVDFNPTRMRTEAIGRQRGNYRDVYQNGGLALVYGRNGRNAHVSVRESGSLRQLKIGAKTDASTPNDMPTQLLLGTVGFLDRPRASSALVVGVGSGATARVVADFPTVQTLDLVEIEPAVAEAARLHFADVNHGVLERADVNVIYDDARAWLSTTAQRYDVIVSEPSNPYIAGIANLFTREFYRRVRSRLTPEGVLVQWIQLYDTDHAMLTAMVRTFLEVFPHTQAWWTYPPDLLLVGSGQPLEIDVARGAATVVGNAGLVADLEPYMDCREPAQIYARYLADRLALETMSVGGALLRDDRPLLDAAASRARYERQAPHALLSPLWRRAAARNWGSDLLTSEIRIAAARAIAPFSVEVAAHFLDNLDRPEAHALRAQLASAPSTRQLILATAMQTTPEDPRLRLELAALHVDAGDRSVAHQLLTDLAESPEAQTARAYVLRARLLSPVNLASSEEILTLVETGLGLVRPREAEMIARRQLLLLAAGCARVNPRALALLQRVAAQNNADEMTRLALAHAFLAAAQPERALGVLDEVTERNFMDYDVEVRLLRVRALVAQSSPQVRDELRRLLEDFPHQAENPELALLIPRVLGATPPR